MCVLFFTCYFPRIHNPDKHEIKGEIYLHRKLQVFLNRHLPMCTFVHEGSISRDFDRKLIDDSKKVKESRQQFNDGDRL